MKEKVEFRIIDTPDMPPIVISQTEKDTPKVVINTHHKIWIGLNRRVIAGIVEALQEKMDMILTGYLKEQREFELMDEELL